MFRIQKSLAKPQIQTVERAWDVFDFPQDNASVGYSVQYPLQIKKTTVTFYVQLVQHFSCVSTHVLA